MQQRVALLPICSAVIGVLAFGLQLVAIATPYWATFRSEDPLGTGVYVTPGEAVEEGYYGLWKLCLLRYRGRELKKDEIICDVIESRFDPGDYRYGAGACAVGNLLLVLIFLSPVPAQLLYLLQNKGVVGVSYRFLTMTKVVAISLGVGCTVVAAVLVNIRHQNPTFEVPKGWSFGLQIIVIVLEVFLVIASLAEHVVGERFPRGPLTRVTAPEKPPRSSTPNLAYHKPPSPIPAPAPSPIREKQKPIPSATDREETDHMICDHAITNPSFNPSTPPTKVRNTYFYGATPESTLSVTKESGKGLIIPNGHVMYEKSPNIRADRRDRKLGVSSESLAENMQKARSRQSLDALEPPEPHEDAKMYVVNGIDSSDESSMRSSRIPDYRSSRESGVDDSTIRSNGSIRTGSKLSIATNGSRGISNLGFDGLAKSTDV